MSASSLAMGAEVAAGSEADLVRRLRQGSASAFEDLVRRFGPALLAVARRLVGNPEDAEDVLQEAFLAALEALPSFEGRAELSTWLHRIVVNRALMKLRRRRRAEPIEKFLPVFTDAGGLHNFPPQRWSESPSYLIEQEDLRRLVRRSIDRLPDSYREAVLLRDIEGMDLAQIADLRGLSVNAVKIRVHRGRKALRTMLDRHFGGSL